MNLTMQIVSIHDSISGMATRPHLVVLMADSLVAPS